MSSDSIAEISDIHFGVRQDSSYFHKNNRKFYTNCFFPELDRRKIDTLIINGDLYDRRKFSSYYTLSEAKEYFFQPLYDRGIKTYVIIGNHDIFLRGSLEINSPSLLFREFDNLTIIDRPITIDIKGIPTCMLPWICSDNYDETIQVIKDTPATDCFGHLEIQGFPMYRNQEVSTVGFPAEMFNKFERVYSGHFHTRSSRGHIQYLGAAGEYTWNDYDDDRGFNIFNPHDKKLEFIPNPYKMFSKLEYDDKNGKTDIKASDVREKFVKIIVTNKTDYQLFDKFIQKVYNNGPYEVKIIDDFSEFTNVTITGDINLENTQEILRKYVDSIDMSADKERIKNYLQQIYIEAINSDFGNFINE
jgi:DNA repair exonuclease SbcCD nuclease subunit